jgi:ribose 5-phosphate isomerase A
MIDDPASSNRALKLVPRVIETGLFIGMADVAVVAAGDGVKIM